MSSWCLSPGHWILLFSLVFFKSCSLSFFQKWVLPWSLCFCCYLNETLSFLGGTSCTMKCRIANTSCHSNCCCVMSFACLRYCAWVLNQGSSVTWKSAADSCFKHWVLVSTDWRVTAPTSASLSWFCSHCATYSDKNMLLWGCTCLDLICSTDNFHTKISLL